jgi:hypothetical protein
MDLIYPINLVGHDEWIKSGYALDLARTDANPRTIVLFWMVFLDSSDRLALA